MDVEEMLEGVVKDGDCLSQHHIFAELAKHRNLLIDQKDEIDFMTGAELLAFDLQPTCRGEDSVWGTYYRPAWVQTRADGSDETRPDKRQFTEELLAYWERRAIETESPFLRFRYASLSWDLRRFVSAKRKFDMTRLIFESSIAIAKKNLVRYRQDGVEFLLYAMKTAIATKSHDSLAQIRSALIEKETQTAEDDMLGTWGYCFDKIFSNKAAVATEAEQHAIVQQISERLDRLISASTPTTPHAIEACVSRLAQYYRRIDDRSELRDLLGRYADKIVQMAEQVKGVFGVTWLQKAHSFLIDFGQTDLAKGLDSAIRAAGATASEAMQTIEHQTTISEDEMKQFLAPFEQEKFESSFLSLAVHFVPCKESVVTNVQRRAAEFPLSSMFGTTKLDENGRPVASVASPEVDMTGNVALSLAQDLQFTSFFIRRAIEHFKKSHLDDLELMTKFILDSPSYPDAGKPIVARALEHFFASQFLEFIHLAVPQVEAAVRQLVATFGGATFKRGRHGSLNLRNLDELIQEPCIVELFQPLGESVALYLKILLTDQRGWNLRNCVAHGLSVPGGMGTMVADRLLHVLMLLALIRMPSEASAEKRDEASRH